MTYLAIVSPSGTLHLGSRAEALGFRPGTLVEVIATSAGSLILAINDSPPSFDVKFRPLEGGAAQLAARIEAKKEGLIR
jgi:hypothetical protein